MTSTYTTNKVIEKPAAGDYPNAWAPPVNSDWDIIDQAFGGSTLLNATGGSATLTASQYRSLQISISGAIAANVTYTIPSGVGGQWIVRNTTTDSVGGPWSIIIASGGGGSSVTVSRNASTAIFCDGTNVRTFDQPAPGLSGQVIYNNSGILGSSSNFTFDGTNISVQGNVAAGAAITATTTVSDTLGNVRNVPLNNQTSSYVLIASDNGKVISITTGGVTVPSSIFSAGNTITIYNSSAVAQTITQGSGVTMILAGDGSTGDRSLNGYGLMTLVCIAANTFVATGSGLS